MKRAEIRETCESTEADVARVQGAQRCMVDEISATRLAETFKALSDPTRVRIISALDRIEMCVCDLAASLGMSQSAISHQLRLLRTLHLVRAEKRGRMVYYSLDDAHVSDLFKQGMEHVAHDEAPMQGAA